MQPLTTEQELQVLAKAAKALEEIQTVGPRQGAILAAISDAVALVHNSMKAKSQISLPHTNGTSSEEAHAT